MKLPSPATTIASFALFIALGGTAIAAVDYARNAGAVDGKSAVAAGSTTTRAAGRLVATNSRGTEKGRIPGKFIADVARTSTFGASVAVADNATGAPAALGTVDGIGTLTASCTDQSQAPGNEDPQTVISFNNTSGDTINMAKRVGGAGATVLPQAPGTSQTLTIGGSTNFTMHVQNRGTQVIIEGVVRQDGRGSADAACLFYGTFLRVS